MDLTNKEKSALLYFSEKNGSAYATDPELTRATAESLQAKGLVQLGYVRFPSAPLSNPVPWGLVTAAGLEYVNALRASRHMAALPMPTPPDGWSLDGK